MSMSDVFARGLGSANHLLVEVKGKPKGKPSFLSF